MQVFTIEPYNGSLFFKHIVHSHCKHMSHIYFWYVFLTTKALPYATQTMGVPLRRAHNDKLTLIQC